ncbi:MAG: tyrosine-type recombinase/integrase [Flavobacteriales bacterium]|nr:tyrosine-type recombinase/integrase [Flavobacteriales bacterium]
MPHIQEFCDYLTHQKRYSKHTVTAYQKDLEQFSLFLEKEFDVQSFQDVSSGFIRSWIVSLIEGDIAARSINRKISSLKSFYKYLQKQQLVDHNPLTKVISPKTSKRLPVFVTESEVGDLFEGITFEDDFEGVRDKLILSLFYYTGMRLSELIELKTSAVNRAGMTMKVLGKRNKERIIPVSPKALKEIEHYLSFRSEVTSKSDRLFITARGEKMYPKLVYRIVNHYLSMVTSNRKKSPHVLRHTFATHMLNNGADLNSIKELLGHANLSATQVYTHNTIEKLKNIHKQAHPKA